MKADQNVEVWRKLEVEGTVAGLIRLRIQKGAIQ